MKTLQAIITELNTHENINAETSEDLLGNETINVKLYNLKSRCDNVTILSYICETYPEIYVNHAFNGFSGTEFEYKATTASLKE